MLLSEMSKIWSQSSWQNSTGIGPSRWFLGIIICCNPVRLPNHCGILPERLLLLRYNPFSKKHLDKLCGISPTKWFSSNSNHLTFVRLKFLENMWPSRLLFDSARISKLTQHTAKCSEISPVKWLLISLKFGGGSCYQMKRECYRPKHSWKCWNKINLVKYLQFLQECSLGSCCWRHPTILNSCVNELAIEKVLQENYWWEKEILILCCFPTTNLEILHSSLCVRDQQPPSHVNGEGIWRMWHHLRNLKTMTEILIGRLGRSKNVTQLFLHVFRCCKHGKSWVLSDWKVGQVKLGCGSDCLKATTLQWMSNERGEMRRCFQ